MIKYKTVTSAVCLIAFFVFSYRFIYQCDRVVRLRRVSSSWLHCGNCDPIGQVPGWSARVLLLIKAPGQKIVFFFHINVTLFTKLQVGYGENLFRRPSRQSSCDTWFQKLRFRGAVPPFSHVFSWYDLYINIEVSLPLRVRFNREINSIINSSQRCFLNAHVTMKLYKDWSHDIVPSVRFA